MSDNYNEPPQEPTPPSPEPEKWLTTKDVLKILNMSPRTLQNWRSNGKIPYYKPEGTKKAYYKSSDVYLALEKARIWKKK